ncbi:hypothetical protein CTAYLR_005436 [Chrysophaeum taylorii]|uniref:AAA+ ATPase domain-containing protein n=1 Tax=Chrysophaeum taylorii TaxID=2483200 RepID=A0AAD7UJP0_9STRA|nr:hypothetical protein CTAYLR_005436 [Chrysophaeum taylorii]
MVVACDVQEASHPGSLEAVLEVDVWQASEAGLELNDFALVTSARPLGRRDIDVCAALVGMVLRALTTLAPDARVSGRVVLAAGCQPEIEGRRVRGAVEVSLRPVRPRALGRWHYVELRAIYAHPDRRIPRGSAARRLEGRLVKRGGLVPNWLDPGSPLRACTCIGVEAAEREVADWGLVSAKGAETSTVRAETRREQYECYGGATAEEARRTLETFGREERRRIELWIEHVARGNNRIIGLKDGAWLSPMILLHGEEGIGKTTLAVASGLACGAEVFFVSPRIFFFEGRHAEEFAADVLSARTSALAGVPTVLVLDALECLCPHAGDVSLDVLSTVMRLRPPPPHLAVVGVTSSLDAVHPFARDAFKWGTWELRRAALWTREARLRLLLSEEEEEEEEEAAADKAAALSGPEILAVVAAGAIEGLGPVEAIDRARLSVRGVDEVATATTVAAAKWSDVAGLREAKRAMRRAVAYPRLYARRLGELGVEPPTGVLLFGPPGVGKTMLARAAAAESKARLLVLSPPTVVSDRVGVSERIVARAFETALAAPPAIIFIDEFDALFPSRDLVDPGQLGGSLVATLCVAFDDLKRRRGPPTSDLGVVILAASNRPDAVDPALLQYGRFDYAIRVPLPDRSDRLEHFSMLLREDNRDDDLVEWLADRTAGFSGADIARLVAAAAREAASSGVASRCHFEAALKVSRTLRDEMELEATLPRDDDEEEKKAGVVEWPTYPGDTFQREAFGDYDELPPD